VLEQVHHARVLINQRAVADAKRSAALELGALCLCRPHNYF
jgi:hypothetical protein